MTVDAWKHIGRVLRTERKKRGWTQQELADAAGVSLRTVGGLENGRPVSAASLDDLTAALGMNTGQVVLPLPDDEPVVAFPDPAHDPGARPVTEARLREEMDRVHDELAEIKRLIAGHDS